MGESKENLYTFNMHKSDETSVPTQKAQFRIMLNYPVCIFSLSSCQPVSYPFKRKNCGHTVIPTLSHQQGHQKKRQKGLWS